MIFQPQYLTRKGNIMFVAVLVFFALHVGYADGIKDGCSKPVSYAAECPANRK